MSTALQRDRDFARSVGIKPDSDTCDMCQLYAIERGRRLDDVIEAAGCVAKQRADLRQQRQTIHMWKLATFAATLMMLLFAFSSIHGGK